MQFTFDKKDPASFPFNSIMVSAILERRNDNGEAEILIQKRLNKNDSAYYGTWEIPAGHIDKFENVYDTVRREILEETNLTVEEFLDDEQTETYSRGDDAAFAFKPFICQQYLKGPGWAWIGFVFRCRVSGTLTDQSDETGELRWVTLADLKALLAEDPKQFFTLQVPVLKHYISFHEKK